MASPHPKRSHAARGAAPPEPDGAPVPLRRRRLRRALVTLLVLPALLALAGAVVLVTYVFASVPLPSDLDVAPTVVYDVRGELIGELQQQATREDVDIGDLPEHVTDAVLAAEDAGFREHSGVSVAGVARAAYTNVVHGEIRQGGSTVSQQYVKNLTGEADETLLRKVHEAVLAVKLERRYSKDEILEFYLNSIYFGRGAYGIQAGARAYFGVDAEELAPEQAALLAGIIPAPSAWDPARDPEAAQGRYAYVLRRLSEEGWADLEQTASMRANYPETQPSRMVVSRRAPFFLAMVEAELSRALGAEQVHRGLSVRTTLDLRMQGAAERHYDAAFAELEIAADETRPTGALVALDPETGGIRALVGGPDYGVDQYNLATGGPQELGRQPGSTFKPFGLAAWVEDGRSPETLVDAPAQVVFTADELGTGSDWEPRNFGDADLGRLSLREATWRSSNTAYAALAVDLGPDRILDVARRAGLDAKGQLRPDPALVLGTGEATPLQLAEAYNTFAAEGAHHKPVSLLEVTRDGNALLTANTDGRRAFDEQVAYHVSDVLEGVLTDGTGTAARLDRPAAGKTGTTSNHADAWFAGYTPDLTAVVWMGHRDDNQPMAGSPTGGGLPASLWGAFMADALEGTDPTPFPEPSGELEAFAEPPDCAEGEVLAPVDPDEADGALECVAAEPEPDPEPDEADEVEEPEPEETEPPDEVDPPDDDPPEVDPPDDDPPEADPPDDDPPELDPPEPDPPVIDPPGGEDES